MQYTDTLQKLIEDMDQQAAQYVALHVPDNQGTSSPKEVRRLQEQLQQKLMVYLYTCPVERHQIPEDDAGAFLDYCLPHLQGIIGAYQNPTLTFSCYVDAAIKKRRLAWYREQKKKSSTEKCLIAYTDIEGVTGTVVRYKGLETEDEPELINPSDATTPEILDRQTEDTLYRNLLRTSPIHANDEGVLPPEGLSFPELFHFLSTYPTSIKPSQEREGYLSQLETYNPAAYKLMRLLYRTKSRRRFLLLLLTRPDLMDSHTIEGCAALMDANIPALCRLLQQAQYILEKQHPHKDSLEKNKNMHWKRLIELQEEDLLYNASEPYGSQAYTKHLLETKLQAFHHRIEDLHHIPPRVSHSNLSKLLDLCHGTVCSGIFYGRQLLAHCLGEYLDEQE